MGDKHLDLPICEPYCVAAILSKHNPDRLVGYISVRAHENDEVTDLRVRQARYLIQTERELGDLVESGIISRDKAVRDLEFTKAIQRDAERGLEESLKFRIPPLSQDVFGLKK